MNDRETRREFLVKTVWAGAYALAGAVPTAVAAGPLQQTQSAGPLPRPKFYWGVGIENCWIAHTDPQKDGNRRLLDVFLQMQHYQKWREDLDLVKEAGFNAIRYGVPWYKAEPRPGVYDWSWIDKPVEYLVEKLKIIPIMDLIHYGTPAWMADGVIDERFPDALGRYAEAMALHFKGLVDHYTPVNEPVITCLKCGFEGIWPPYHKSVESWAKIGVRVAKGMVLEMEAIRRAVPHSAIVSAETFIYPRTDKVLAVAKADLANIELRRAASCLPAALAYGKVAAGHPMADFLKQHGVSETDLTWFENRKQPPDILGYNNYPGVGGSDAKGLQESARRGVEQVKKGLLDAQSYFNLPVYLTETSAGLTGDAKIAYIEALYDLVQQLRRERVPIVGVNWWPLYETIQWDYRDKPEQPLASFIRPGGWNNGLYKIKVESDGDLKRVPTAAVRAIKDMIGRDMRQATAAVGTGNEGRKR